MKPAIRLATIAAVGGLALATAAASVMAQGVPEFRDAKTGKVWTPYNVSQDGKAPANQAPSAADKAFDPQAQIASVDGVTVQRPRANLMGLVPITAGPTVPIVTIDGPSLQAVPGQRWLTVLYLTNNSDTIVDSVVGCTFTNGDRKVEDTRVIMPPAGPGERIGVPVYGPRVEVFVDRVTCRVLSPI